MKLTVKKSEMVKVAVKLAAAATKKESIIVVEIDNGGTPMVSFSATGDMQVYTTIRLGTKPEGYKKVAIPAIFIAAVSTVAGFAEDINMEFKDNEMSLSAGTAKVPIPYIAEEIPDTVLGNTMGYVTVDTAALKAAINSVRQFILPAKSGVSWVNCIGLDVQDAQIKLIGASSLGVAYKSLPINNHDLTVPRLAVSPVLLSKAVSLMDDESTWLYVMGEKNDKGTFPKSINVMDKSGSMYIIPLLTTSYGNVENMIDEFFSTSRFKETFKKKDLISAIKVAELSDNNSFMMRVENGKMHISDIFNKGYVDVYSSKGSVINSELKKTYFNPVFFSNAVNSVSADDITLYGNSEGDKPQQDLVVMAEADGVRMGFMPIVLETAETQGEQVKQQQEEQ